MFPLRRKSPGSLPDELFAIVSGRVLAAGGYRHRVHSGFSGWKRHYCFQRFFVADAAPCRRPFALLTLIYFFSAPSLFHTASDPGRFPIRILRYRHTPSSAKRSGSSTCDRFPRFCPAGSSTCTGPVGFHPYPIIPQNRVHGAQIVSANFSANQICKLLDLL